MGETQGKQPQKELCNLKANANYALDSGFIFSLRKKKKGQAINKNSRHQALSGTTRQHRVCPLPFPSEHSVQGW